MLYIVVHSANEERDHIDCSLVTFANDLNPSKEKQGTIYELGIYIYISTHGHEDQPAEQDHTSN